MDTKYLFFRHWWRVCYHRYQVTKGKRQRQKLRDEMRRTALEIGNLVRLGDWRKNG